MIVVEPVKKLPPSTEESFFAECDRDSVIRRVAVYRRDLRKENHDDGNYCQKRADERNKFVQ